MKLLSIWGVIFNLFTSHLWDVTFPLSNSGTFIFDFVVFLNIFLHKINKRKFLLWPVFFFNFLYRLLFEWVLHSPTLILIIDLKTEACTPIEGSDRFSECVIYFAWRVFSIQLSLLDIRWFRFHPAYISANETFSPILFGVIENHSMFEIWAIRSVFHSNNNWLKFFRTIYYLFKFSNGGLDCNTQIWTILIFGIVNVLSMDSEIVCFFGKFSKSSDCWTSNSLLHLKTLWKMHDLY